MEVQLDPALQVLIATVVTGVFSFAINYFATSIPWLAVYLGQHRVAVITWLTGVIVTILQSQLDRVPESWDSVLVLVMKLIVEVAFVFTGFAYLSQKKNVQSVS